MANITKITARFSGVVAYSDNTSSMFHCGGEGEEADYVLWSVERAESIESLKQVSWSGGFPWPWWRAIRVALSSFNFMTFDWDTPLPDIQKKITNMTGRCDFIFAFDDNTVATAAVAGSGSINPATGMLSEMVTVEDAAIENADNIAIVRLGLRTFFRYVMEQAWVTA